MDGDGALPEFSYEQFHHILLMTAREASAKFALPDAGCEEIVAFLKDAFPIADPGIEDEPVFSKAQAKQLMEVTVQMCRDVSMEVPKATDKSGEAVEPALPSCRLKGMKKRGMSISKKKR